MSGQKPTVSNKLRCPQHETVGVHRTRGWGVFLSPSSTKEACNERHKTQVSIS